jgi:large subunit ribosomal protein L29
MNAAELRKMSGNELQKELTDKLRESFNLRMQQGTGQLSRPNQMRKVRKDIARINTVMNEQKKAGNAYNE